MDANRGMAVGFALIGNAVLYGLQNISVGIIWNVS